MAHHEQTQAERHVYRVQGFTCANCAGKFEKNVKRLPGVQDAQVNFGASKLTVIGRTSIDALEQAGAFENLRVAPEHERPAYNRRPWWKENGHVLAAAVMLAIGYGSSLSYGDESLYSWAAFAASILIGGYSLFAKGLKNLFRLQFDMNTLMTVAVIGAAAIGEWGEGATVVILFAISEMLERYSMEKARQSIRSLMNMAPREAEVRRGEQTVKLPVEDIRIGDIMIVKPGQKLALDGIVVRGQSAVNQAAITGESIPAAKSADDEVYAGTLNGEGLLEVKVTRGHEDTTLAKIIHLVEEAQAERAPSQQFVDRFARYYTPAIMSLALAIAVIPPLVAGGSWSEWIYRGLALLVVGCPCALVISTPVSIVTAIGNAARNGVLIKGGIHLEEAGRLAAVGFDKTGTLTRGVPVVTDLVTVGSLQEKRWLGLAAALERQSQHPLAAAIVRKAEAMGAADTVIEVDSFRSVTSKGLSASISGRPYWIGSPSYCADLGITLPDIARRHIEIWQSEAKTAVVFGTAAEVLGVAAIADEIRPTSRAVIDELHRMGIRKTVLLTGDNRATAKAIGEQLRISDIQAELMPQEKLARIKQLRQEYGHTAMVGDGVNDAPALAAATVGIAMGGAGTDTALETADIALMADDLAKLPYTIRLSRKTLAIIKQNVSFALGIKLLALLLIVPGWLTLWMAIFADMGATLLVTLNSLRLLRVRDKA
ncbi:cadmium-translocating P-type ATPase [Xylanibacillus composti]|uniref:Cd(2+)-exporting ATPase n=1 Tax=Xylanibacillus composti TaxID=1572762 RepID=A0A8J4M3Y1_9BACL|nr:heavy metal translocating P-type ATPase [Xylanibacillus composti]MDT9726325.1 cadmium-translocating P-type ATPase [Xylanibacillus composti]GIQ70567.1 copper-translocating P-type ATPase [Xylanibacillus composti]